MLFKVSSAGSLISHGCEDAVFPQLFGSNDAEVVTGQEVVLGIDYHYKSKTVVAVGYFNDKSLARTETGEYNEEFYESITGSKFPFINIYCEDSELELDISFWTMTQSDMDPGFNGALLDVAIL